MYVWLYVCMAGYGGLLPFCQHSPRAANVCCSSSLSQHTYSLVLARLWNTSATHLLLVLLPEYFSITSAVSVPAATSVLQQRSTTAVQYCCYFIHCQAQYSTMIFSTNQLYILPQISSPPVQSSNCMTICNQWHKSLETFHIL